MRFRIGHRLAKEHPPIEFDASTERQVEHCTAPPSSPGACEGAEKKSPAACAERIAAVLADLGYGVAVIPRATKPTLN